MSELDGPAKLKQWMSRNRSGLISNLGNPGNRVTPYLYNIIFNNNINIISTTKPALEAVTQGPLEEVTRVTGDSAPQKPWLPELPEKISLGNQSNQTISASLPQIPQLPTSAGKRELDPERTFLSEFLSWMDVEAGKWPGETLEVMFHIRAWFQGQGYQDPADQILAFVTVQDLMRRKGGPVVLAPEAAGLEMLAREVFGREVVVCWSPRGTQK